MSPVTFGDIGSTLFANAGGRETVTRVRDDSTFDELSKEQREPADIKGNLNRADKITFFVGGYGDYTSPGGVIKENFYNHQGAAAYFTSEQDQALEAYLAQYSDKNITVIGHSWGADTAVDAIAKADDPTIKHPNASISLVTVDGVSTLSKPTPTQIAKVAANTTEWTNFAVDYNYRKEKGLTDTSDIIGEKGGAWILDPDVSKALAEHVDSTHIHGNLSHGSIGEKFGRPLEEIARQTPLGSFPTYPIPKDE